MQITERQRRPHWLKVNIPGGENYSEVKALVNEHHLHTVCQSARCPNIEECWNRRTATFMILGEVCTRDCAFCAVPHGIPSPLDMDEAKRVASAVDTLSLNYAVITSVTRDDLQDGGADLFAEVIKQIRLIRPKCQIEVLIPDFQGNNEALMTVLNARPDVLNHNVETVARLYPTIRPQANYQQSLTVIKNAKEFGSTTKSGIMIGLGETKEEVLDTMRDLHNAGCDLLTIGQYLQPTSDHIVVSRYVRPEEFTELKTAGEEIGFKHVESGPLVRSSYHADEQAQSVE